MARSDEWAYPNGSAHEERQSHSPKGPQPEGFRQKWPGDFLAPQSQIHAGYAPSSSQNREELPGFAGCLVRGPFLTKQQYPEFFNGLLSLTPILPIKRHDESASRTGLHSTGILDLVTGSRMANLSHCCHRAILVLAGSHLVLSGALVRHGQPGNPGGRHPRASRQR